ncbi:MAG: PAS domain S-box protein [Anaerolineae bacterium]|nr:PAS domain S-box protein [Anaerolineae bacterium]
MSIGTDLSTTFDVSMAVILAGLELALLLVIALTIRSWILNQNIQSRTKQLSESENKYRSLIETAAEGVAVSTHREILFANQRTSDIFGYPHDELLKMSPADVIHQSEWAKLREIVKLRRTGDLWSKTNVFKAVAKDKQDIFVRLNSTEVTWDGRKAILHLISDITEQVQTEQALKKSEEMFFKAFQISPDCININRLSDGIFLQANEGFTRLTGYTADEVIGKSIEALNLWGNPKDRQHIVKSLLQSGEINNFVTGFRLKDGSIRMGSHSAKMIELNNEKCVLSITRDIDEQVRANQMLQLQLDRLASLRKIDLAIIMGNNIRHTMQIILEQARILLQVDAASILELSADQNTLSYLADSGFRGDVTSYSIIPLEGTFAGKAIRTQKMVLVPNTRTQKSFFVTDFFRKEQFVSYIALPLVANNKAQGVLQFMHRNSFTPDREWLQFAQVLADQAALAIYSQNLVTDLQTANEELEKAYDETITGWARALELRDGDTQGHSSRVADLAVELSRNMGMGHDELLHIRRGALLHDIGKMGIPDEILLKPGPLSKEEFQLMRTHPSMGYQLLSSIKFLQPALDIPLFHHERWDGSGYPEGLSGTNIPLAARIFAVIDVWDALISDRPYRAAWHKKNAWKYIKENAGVLFDPAVVSAFEKLLRQGNFNPIWDESTHADATEFPPGSRQQHPAAPDQNKLDLTAVMRDD